MSATRPRTRFATPIVVTFAASCSSTATPPQGHPMDTWIVSVQPAGCMATAEDHCPPNVMCNPPPPRAVECPPGASPKRPVRLRELGDGSCAVLPPGCDDASCAAPKTPCLLPVGQDLPALAWTVAKAADGTCTATGGGVLGPRPQPIACPAADVTGLTIRRPTATAPCVAEQANQPTHPVDCPK